MYILISLGINDEIVNIKENTRKKYLIRDHSYDY